MNKSVKQGLHFCHAFFDELGEAFGVLHEKIKKTSLTIGEQLDKKTATTQHLRKEEEDHLPVLITCTSRDRLAWPSG